MPRPLCSAPLALALALLACGPAAAPPAPAPSAPAPTPALSASAAPALKPFVLGAERIAAALGKRGKVADERFLLQGTSPPRWLAFLVGKVGDGEAIRSAWLVDAEGEPVATPVTGFPVASRLVAGAAQKDTVALLLESVAFDDQPGGLPGAVEINARQGSSSPLMAFDAVPDLDLAGLPAWQEKAADFPDEAALRDRLRRGALSPERVAALVDPSGLSVEELWQGTFRRRRALLPAAEVARSPEARGLAEALGALPERGVCFPGVCEVHLDEMSRVGLAGPPEQERIRAWKRAAPEPRAPSPRAARAAAATDELAAALPEHFFAPMKAWAAGPLGASGSVGVISTIADPPEFQAAVARQGAFASYELLYFNFMAGAAPDAFQTRFADVDGDGRTDLLLFPAPSAGNLSAAVYLTPSLLRGPPDTEVIRPEHGLGLAALLAPSVDAAVEAILRVPARPVTPAEACALMRKATTPAGLRSVATPGAPVLTFTEPGMPTLRAEKAAVAQQRELLKGLPEHCDTLTCDPRWPLCRYSSEPYSEYFWFAPDGKKLKFAGLAFYTGS